MLTQLSITEDLEFFFGNCLRRELSSPSHASTLLISNRGWPSLASRLFLHPFFLFVLLSFSQCSYTHLLLFFGGWWGQAGAGSPGETRVTSESPLTQCWLVTWARVTCRRDAVRRSVLSGSLPVGQQGKAV